MTDTKYRFIIVELFISLILLNTCSYPLAKAEGKMNSDYEIAVAKMPETPPKPVLDLEKLEKSNSNVHLIDGGLLKLLELRL